MFKRIGLIFATIFLLHACSSVDHGVVCTEEFVQFTVQVFDPSDEPAGGVDIQVVGKNSGDVYPCDEYLCKELSNGHYVIMHDMLHGVISESGETLIVEGMKDGLAFSEEFTFRSGECHVEKVSGPETVTLSEI